MISFKPYEKQIICKEKFANIDEFEEKLSSAIAEYGEENIALCFEFSRPTVRIFDGYGYFFLYPYLADEDEGFDIRVKTFPIKPMSPEEAILQMELLGHQFYMFRDAETEDVCVVYCRKDGNYGLIQTQ